MDSGDVTGSALKGRDEHFIQHDAERPDVAARVQRLAADGFRAHVGQRAQKGTVLRQAHVAMNQARQAKIGETRRAVRCQQHVVRFQIAVNDARFVRQDQRVRQG